MYTRIHLENVNQPSKYAKGKCQRSEKRQQIKKT